MDNVAVDIPESDVGSSWDDYQTKQRAKCAEDLAKYNLCINEYNLKLQEYNQCLSEKVFNEFKYCFKPTKYCYKPLCAY